MKADKNTIIGFVLLGILFFVYFWYTNKQQAIVKAAEVRAQDSIALVNSSKIKPADPVAAYNDSIHNDSLSRISQAGSFQQAGVGSVQQTVVENNLMKVTFSNKGGEIKSVELKNFKSIDSTPVKLSGGKDDAIGYTINTGNNQSAETSNLYFIPSAIVKNNDSSQTISYTLSSAGGQTITHQYTIHPNNYMIDWNIALNGASQLLTGNVMNFHWKESVNQHQYSGAYEKEQSRICFYDDKDGYDFKRASSGVTKDFDNATDWISFKQQFFNTTIISKDKFKGGGKAAMNVQPDSSKLLFMADATMQIQVPAAATVTVPLQMYYGPNAYYTLKKYDNHLEEIVDLGSGIYSFVKYINRWIIMPVFDFLSSFIKNFGWVIALLTLFIRLVTSPLTYTSYLSGAKMKVLRPELAELKKKHGDDQQAYAVDQMKIFREAGVNPLGGCIPALLQIPIFFALYSFFSSNILLRGQSFLWAHDLSTYDVIAKLPFSIPNYGDHVSLFTLTAVLTNFLIAFYNMSMTPDQSNPAMKYMPYIFPFVLLFIFNRLPAALTWYYTVSNTITLGIQFVIQNYIINHDKILADIQVKRKTPKQQSKWQERFQQTMEAQKKVQELKNKTKK